MTQNPFPVNTRIEDCASAFDHFENGRWDSITVMGNRYLENLIFDSKKDHVHIGIILRTIGMNMNQMRGRGQYSDEEIDAGRKMISFLTDLSGKNEIDIKDLWKRYEDYHTIFWNSIRPRLFTTEYSENKDITNEVLKYVVSKLKENKDSFINGDTTFCISGTINMVERFTQYHLASASSLLKFNILTCFDWWLEYPRYLSYKDEDKFNKDKWNELVKEKFEKLIDVLDIEDDSIFNESTYLIFELMSEWRDNFIKYFEVHLSKQKGQNVQMVPFPVSEQKQEEDIEHSKKRRGKR